MMSMKRNSPDQDKEGTIEIFGEKSQLADE